MNLRIFTYGKLEFNTTILYCLSYSKRTSASGNDKNCTKKQLFKQKNNK